MCSSFMKSIIFETTMNDLFHNMHIITTSSSEKQILIVTINRLIFPNHEDSYEM
jgi:hypothetical protein